ncbi:MAG: 3-deoxy-7-phosphoheptulonate synthase [Ignavibacteria bacterium]|nr:3-deoxy-7-phosphoheptulonate synthase [Ignavibacteria bacterium]
MDIAEYRQKIDTIDDELVSLISQRKHLSEVLIQHKLQSNMPVFDAAREDAIIDRHIQHYADVNPVLIEKLFHLLFANSKRQHYKNEHLSPIADYINRKPIIIAGPCVVESDTQIDAIATALSAIGVKFLRGGTFKPRTSPTSFQGLGDEGVKLLATAAKKCNMYSVTEILEAEQYARNSEYIDIVQIGSRSMTSYGLLKSIGKLTATDNKFVLLKRGFSATINEFLLAADYILQSGNSNVILCLRGIRTFEQIDSSLRFTPDLASILELKEKNNLPVIFDPSHSSGNAKYIVPISNAALQLGADGLLIESHCNPLNSLVDASQAITPNELLHIINL